MSFRAHLLWRSIALFGVFLAGWCLMWFAREFVTYNKTFFGAFVSSWWNLLIFVGMVPVVAFASFVDDLIGFEEGKEQ